MSTPAPTSSVLYGAWRHIEKECKEPNEAFLKCKAGNTNPENCLQQGETVTACAGNVIAELHQQCRKQFAAYVKCLTAEGEFNNCRKQEKALEECRSSK
eukprot:CAMPEP_0113881826 /NCGR_PEP_ID=MMETSP0780_2-20120614/8597_1 /TAXON_ID=652834 /ORGANISM="Palpitomonas bilix" /LENGTH=98 /DNA_ID=CAMNT_0000868737 /DNA_START=24 /DNA_END=320 /DNA_ORIENTATION=- /assembly_acc=CAM_ASM_000599